MLEDNFTSKFHRFFAKNPTVRDFRFFLIIIATFLFTLIALFTLLTQLEQAFDAVEDFFKNHLWSSLVWPLIIFIAFLVVVVIMLLLLRGILNIKSTFIFISTSLIFLVVGLITYFILYDTILPIRPEIEVVIVMTIELTSILVGLFIVLLYRKVSPSQNK